MESLDIIKLASKHLFRLQQECPHLLDAHLVICRMKQMIECAITLNAHDKAEIRKSERTREPSSKRF